MSRSDTFPGFPKQTLQYFRKLAKNNDKAWFQDHREDYQQYVVEPARAFVERLGSRLQSLTPEIRFDTRTNGSGSIMRIHRDIRFSKDKSPYKPWLSVIFWVGEGKKTELPGYYFHLDPVGTYLCGGQHAIPRSGLERYRKAVAGEKTGKALDKALAPLLRTSGYSLEGEHYKRVPKGFDPEHRRADLLRYAGLYVRTSDLSSEILSSSRLESECMKHWKKTAPLVRWLSEI